MSSSARPQPPASTLRRPCARSSRSCAVLDALPQISNVVLIFVILLAGVSLSFQVLLDDVNNGDPAQEEAFRVYRDDKGGEYKKRVRAQVARLQAL